MSEAVEPPRLSPTGELQLIAQHQIPLPASCSLVRPLHVLDHWVAATENAVLIMLLLGMMLLGTLQVIMRELLNLGLPWADIVLRHMVLWSGMVGAMVATRAGRHLNMDALARLLPIKLRRWIDVTINLLAATCCAILLLVAFPYLQEEMATFTEPLFGPVRHWQVELIFPVAFAIMAFRFLLAALDGILGSSIAVMTQRPRGT
ncbi:MAG: TRAP transporter small permease subunit [Cyanobacteria bacterium NC_groundwater_1444_Ag_S-0.65um_54_12]|nr:TRAP transporter small permease subunit [Cyanobacteria bacterium NC_groundwater_1444_Ag_S-0.65um_54_12]